jgi:hypothetical protein
LSAVAEVEVVAEVVAEVAVEVVAVAVAGAIDRTRRRGGNIEASVRVV